MEQLSTSANKVTSANLSEFSSQSQNPREKILGPTKTHFYFCHLISIVLFFLLTSCSSPNNPTITEFSGNTMTIDYRVLIGRALTPSEQAIVNAIIQSTFHEVDMVYNKWNPQSELSLLNRFPVEVPFALSPKLEKLLLLTSEMVHLTDGRFDPTIESVQELWKNESRPTKDALQKLAVGWHHLQFTPGIVIKSQDVKLDLGGIAKGYAVDFLLHNLQVKGFKDIYVEWGGEIAVEGKHPSGRPWTIYISRLDDASPDNAVAVVPLHHQAVATSGDYLQQWKVDDETYFHIINPRTKQPLKSTKTSIASASVCANTCAFADGLATAAMLFSTVDEAEKWLMKIKEKHPEITFWLISRANFQ